MAPFCLQISGAKSQRGKSYAHRPSAVALLLLLSLALPLAGVGDQGKPADRRGNRAVGPRPAQATGWQSSERWYNALGFASPRSVLARRSARWTGFVLMAGLALALWSSSLPTGSAEARAQRGAVVAAAAQASISVSPGSGSSGSALEMSGVRFPKRQVGQVYWDGSASGMPSFRTNGSGSFSVSAVVPSVTLAGHSVSAGVGSVTASAQYTVTVVSPGATPTATSTTTATPTPTSTLTPTLTPTPTSRVTPELLFSDEFDGTSLDLSKWHTCFWWATDTCSIESNNELELYVKDDVLVGGGILTLRAQRRTAPGWNGKTYRYTSGMVSTGGRKYEKPPGFAYTYGYAEARVRVPRGQGLWPAFWMLPVSYRSRPEIDIMEILGDQPDVHHMNYHWLYPDGTRGDRGATWAGPAFSVDWHSFGVDWQPGAIVWYVDGIERWRFTDAANVPAEPMYLLLNLAVGGDWPGSPNASTPFASYYQVDYVRVWRTRPQ